MEATKYGDCVDPSLCRERPWNRLLVIEGLVRTGFVVEAHVLDAAPEVILTEDEDVVEQLSSERTGEAFSECIHVRRAYRRAHDAHPRRPENASETSAELRIGSRTTTCGARSMVAFLDCCAHQSSAGV